MDRFSLLRLPTVALKEVLKCFTPIELYHLSGCSRKMAQLILLAGTKKISLKLNFRKLKIVMNKEYVFQFCNEFSHTSSKPNTFVFDFPHASYAKMVDELRNLGFYISALFKCPIKSLTFYGFTSSGLCRSIIEEIITSQDTPLEKLILSGDLKEEDLKWILETVNVTGKFNIWIEELENVSANLNLNCRHLLFFPAPLVTVDRLVSLKSCKTIQLFETNLTYQDLDGLMEKWKSGLFPNLEYFWVAGDSLENNGNIVGFSDEQLSAKRGSEREKMVDNENFGTCDRGVDVKNIDGIKGSIQIHGCGFQLFVWKD